MKRSNCLQAIISIFIFTLPVIIFASCGGDQSEEADFLVSEANKNIAEASALVKETEKRNKELFAVSIQTDEALREYKNAKEREAQKIIEDFEKASELAETASNQLAEAGKMDVPEKYREYLEIRALELARRAEAAGIRKGNAQAFLEHADATMIKKFEENNEKSERLLSEARELGRRADEIQTEIQTEVQ